MKPPGKRLRADLGEDMDDWFKSVKQANEFAHAVSK